MDLPPTCGHLRKMMRNMGLGVQQMPVRGKHPFHDHINVHTYVQYICICAITYINHSIYNIFIYKLYIYILLLSLLLLLLLLI